MISNNGLSSKDGRVDLHHHMLPTLYLDALEKAGVDTTRFPSWTPEKSLQMMERQGIARAILSVSSPGVWLGNDAEARRLARTCNEYTAELRARHPHRFGGLASLPCPDLTGAVDEAAYALDSLRLDGVLLLTNTGGRYVGDPEYDALMSELDRRGTLVLLHPNQVPADDENAPLYGWAEYPIDLARAFTRLALNDVLLRYPNIRWVLTHAGGVVPFMAERLGKVHYMKNGKLRWWRILRDLTAKRNGGLELAKGLSYEMAGSANPVTLAALHRLVGPDRVVFGSNYPWDAEVAA